MERVIALGTYYITSKRDSKKGSKSTGKQRLSNGKLPRVSGVLFGRSSSARFVLKGGVSKLIFVDDETLKKVAVLFGEDAVRVVEVLKGVHEITDDEIAGQTEIRLNMVRKALYRLHDHFLVALR